MMKWSAPGTNGQPEERVLGTAQRWGWGGTGARLALCGASAMTHCVSPRDVSPSPTAARAVWVQFFLPAALSSLSEQPAPQTPV